MPEIDSDIFGECQALLFNFDRYLEKEFGEGYCIREALTFSLQLFPSRESLANAIKTNTVAKDIFAFINNFRSSISSDVLESGNYSFKAFLIQVVNHQNSEALPIQFIQWDKLDDNEKAKAKKVIAIVKQKHTDIPIINSDLIKAKYVVEKIQEALGNKKVKRGNKEIDYFNMTTHTRAWQKYKIRPIGNSKHPSKTNNDFCIYDKAHNDYLYREKWIEFLIEKFTNENEYYSLYES